MKIAITGSSGLIGTALLQSLSADGHEVVRLVRRPAVAADEVEWDPAARSLDPAALDGIDGGVNLAGVGFGDRRWTSSFKKSVRDSRVDATELFAEALGASGASVLVSGSAVGYYGNRGEEELTEESAPGEDFGAKVCIEWEAATAAAEQAGVRVAHIRTGLVMSREADLLKRLVLPFKLGVGGRIGSGRQYWSWIDIHDEVAAIRFLLDGDGLSGPFNLTAPKPVRFDEVKEALGRILRRPTILPVPSVAMKLLFGAERAESIVLAGQRVVPQRLVDAGFGFAYTDLEVSLRHHLGR
jgi:uncharacterized protein (TIGR01777 family)